MSLAYPLWLLSLIDVVSLVDADDNASSSSSPVPAYALREDQFTLSLLTQGHWPQPPPPSSSSSSSASNEDGHEDSAQTSNNNNFGLHLSAELLLTQRAFTVFYAAHYQGRRLRWTHSLSRCLVSMHLAGKGSAGGMFRTTCHSDSETVG